MVTPCLGLLPARQPAAILPLPEMARSCPPSCTRWGCSLLASRHPCSLTLRWLIPVHGLVVAGAAPSREPASLFPLPEMAHSCPAVLPSLQLLPHRNPTIA